MEITNYAQPDTPNVAESKRKIGFLDLPAELRNTIYDLLATTIGRKDYMPRTRSDADTASTRLKYLPWPRLVRGDLSLAQTCRQIRSEYLPIYAASTKVHISMHAFALAAEDLNVNKHEICMPASHVELIVRLYGYHGCGYRPCHDIAPLLRLALRQPELEFKFKDEECMREKVIKGEQRDTSAYLTTLFSFHTNPVWCDFFTDAVREVFMYPDDFEYGPRKRAKVHIEVEEEYGELWMQRRGARSGGQDKIDEWLPTVGLEGLVGWHGLEVHWAKGWFEDLFEE
ncbi:hypothetical protein BKA58DRAFT_174778 [Alternaria rosae]|uniref:uncharacterized protein n=1 Tax=Alternaria rosae TaxID=1187941 RepID=UPI001E8D9151|nr:uncharacterized protein BKA58DRAFT_174778 [Alternaria rosae]KAH6870342.1 hypothetical protein BKA58DRAFT_174778 [Alternaria rosae]